MTERVPRAWMRRWYFDGEAEYKIKNPTTGRMIIAKKFMFLPVTPNKVLDDDVPLYDDEAPKDEARGLRQ